ncbi:hypothetical protein K2173_003854 [Erythroxylum novogranatense]|uniref:Small ribosomal subunit protein bS18c n=1 Tax=Erythroxylum novogranatense TaxID=1862640 RepID=A0AAV8TTD2_9ROSI|nr:hypothetical protein K2173_003854 [Erythroxylum novogranatense]
MDKSKRLFLKSKRSFSRRLNMSLISRFISEQGKILSRRVNRLTLKQRFITIAIKQARILSLLSFLNNEKQFEKCELVARNVAFYEAQIGEFVLEAEELLKLQETLTRVYAQRMGKPLRVVSEDMKRDAFMSAIEAQAHGIVDLVAVA